MFNWFKKKIELKNENAIISSICERRGTKVDSEIIIPTNFEGLIYCRNKYYYTLSQGKHKFTPSLAPKLFAKRKKGKPQKRIKIVLHYINKDTQTIKISIKKQLYNIKFIIEDSVKFAELMLLYTYKPGHDYASQYLAEIFEDLMRENKFKINEIPQTSMLNYGIKIIEITSDSSTKLSKSIFDNTSDNKSEAITPPNIVEHTHEHEKDNIIPASHETQNCCPKCKYPIKFATKYCLRCGYLIEE